MFVGSGWEGNRQAEWQAGGYCEFLVAATLAAKKRKELQSTLLPPIQQSTDKVEYTEHRMGNLKMKSC